MRTRRPGPIPPTLLLAALVLSAAAGCGTTKVSGTQRTATEQLLLTNAWDDALRQVDFRPLTGVPVYFDTTNLNAALDQGWIISSIRQAMLAQGVLLRAKPEQAQWIVEARVGVYGTNDHNLVVGIPQTTLPATIPGVPAGSIPEVPLAKRTKQEGVVKMALYSYDRASGQVTWTSGTMLATANAKDLTIGGIGPIQSGSIRKHPEFVGVQLPNLATDSSSAAPGPAAPPRGDVPYHAPTLSLPTSAADQDAFAP